MMRSQMPRGALPRLLLLTSASIASSLVITAIYTWALFGWPGDSYFSSYAIWRCALIGGVGVPAVIAPFVIWRLTRLVDQLGIAHEALSRIAATDALTGLLNRRGFEPLAERALSAAQSQGLPSCALVCDIDMFKSINDRFGHDVGDNVIRRVGARLNEGLGEVEAFICRYGGEEFVVVLPGLSAPQALASAEKLRTACAAEEAAGGDPAPAVTISIGLAETSGSHLPDLLRCADAALYEAKRNGRNRVECYAPPPRLEARA